MIDPHLMAMPRHSKPRATYWQSDDLQIAMGKKRWASSATQSETRMILHIMRKEPLSFTDAVPDLARLVIISNTSVIGKRIAT